jgi:hypothetical protein
MVLIVADNMVVGEAEVVNMAVMVVAEGEWNKMIPIS